MRLITLPRKSLLLLGLLIVAGALLATGAAFAWPKSAPQAQVSTLHPTFALLDQSGQNVLDTGGAVSTLQTCGQCHDTGYIASHNFHADLGLSDLADPGGTASGRPWDTSPGDFGKWNPLIYRLLSPPGDERLDLSTVDWLRLFGDRHVGGGPAVTSRNGAPLVSLPADASNPETSATNSQTGQAEAWNWAESGVAELNCFLCHLSQPNNEARIQALRQGRFAWASTATLLGTGIVESQGQGWAWNQAAFDENGELLENFVTIQDPDNQACAQCHGVVHTDKEQILVITGCELGGSSGYDRWQTATTGQVFSGQKISASGLNLSGKSAYARAWDVHAERGLKCTDCHYSLNNPAYTLESAADQPEYLSYDPRRLEIGEYLEKPDHNFARGQSAQFTVDPEGRGTMRRCESCHAAVSTHDWLPYTERHMQEVACETCHIPRLAAPAIQSVDWTVLASLDQPGTACRGVEGSTGTLNDLVTGFEPVLLPRQNQDGTTFIAPYNLITAWYWVYQDANGNTRPVRLVDLQAAWLPDGEYAPEVMDAFDANGDERLSSTELVINTSAKAEVIAARLESLGLKNPRITGEVQPYSVNHNVVSGEWAIEDCKTCHSDASRITRPIKLAEAVPGGVMPEFVKDVNTIHSGRLYTAGSALYYQPTTQSDNLYVFGHSRVGWIDLLGGIFFVGVLVAVAGHGGLRFYTALRAPKRQPCTRQVYMYAVYERFWHWLQTFAIVLLLFTGLVIHRPDVFGIFSFRHIVVMHNVLAALLVINAALSLFYHLASGEIRQFIPRPYGFFDQAIVQAKFYLQGIFKGDPHPFEKTPQKKLNPLQQATYFGILNVLLPLQVITGALMWGVQRWPEAASLLGGLPFLAPFHSLVAWLFASFIVGHVYLTTTNPDPLSSIRAMMLGWDEVEENETIPQEETRHDDAGYTETQGTEPEVHPA